MKGKGKSASMSVMLALLAVLLVSLGFLSTQKEGFDGVIPDENTEKKSNMVKIDEKMKKKQEMRENRKR
jgi:hypothetical protein